jgi:hypothetical protein
MFSKIRNKTKVSTLFTLNQSSTQIISQNNKARKRNQRDTNRKEERKISLLTNDKII